MGNPRVWLALSTILIVGQGAGGAAWAAGPKPTPEERIAAAQRLEAADEAEHKAAEASKLAARTALEAAQIRLDVAKTQDKAVDLAEKAGTVSTRITLQNAQNLKAAQAATVSAKRRLDLHEGFNAMAALVFPTPAGGLELSKRFGITCKGGIDPQTYAARFEVSSASHLVDTRPIREFAACYRKRAVEIQRRSDIASWTTGAGLVGLLVAGNTMAPKKTKVMWTSAAILPLILNDLRGTGYRSQLYSAGAEALDQVAFRYDELAFRLNSAKGHIDDIDTNRAGLNAACADVGGGVRRAKALPDTARRTTVLEGLQAIFERCEAAGKARRKLRLILSGVGDAESTLQRYANDDALRVANRMDLLQRAVRATPFEVFRSIGKLPFATVDALISGKGLEPRTDPRGDLDYLVAGRRLYPDAPALPDELEPTVALSQAFEQALDEYVTEGRAATTKKGLTAAEKKVLKTHADESVAILNASVAARERLAEAIPIFNEARLKAAAVVAWDQGRIPSLDPKLIDKRVLSLSTVIVVPEAEGEAAKP